MNRRASRTSLKGCAVAALISVLLLSAAAFAGEPAPPPRFKDPVALPQGERAPHDGILIDPEEAKQVERDRVLFKRALDEVELLKVKVKNFEELDATRTRQVGNLEQIVQLQEQQIKFLREALASAQQVSKTLGEMQTITKAEADELRKRLAEMEKAKERKGILGWARDILLFGLGVFVGKGL